MYSYKDLRRELCRQNKAKYNPCCLKGILVPKQLFVASQFAHFRQLQGNSYINTHEEASFPGAMMLHGLVLLQIQGYGKFKHLLKLC